MSWCIKMGNCCPSGSSYDVVKPPQSQDPGVARADSVISDNNGGSYKKKENAYIVPKSKPAPATYDNEALDLRERKLSERNNGPHKNGPVVMQPVSEMDLSLSEDKPRQNGFDAEIDDIDISMADMQAQDITEVKKPIATTTVVFNASSALASNHPDDEDDELFVTDDPDYDSIRPTYSSPTYDDVRDTHHSPGKKTTVVSMKMSELQADAEAEDDPHYATADVTEMRPKSDSQSSVDSHAYSNPDLGGYQHNTRATIQADRARDEEDDYAAIGYGEIKIDEDDEADYYEIGDKRMTEIIQQKNNFAPVNGNNDFETEKVERTSPVQSREVTDIYAIVDKSKKSHEKRRPGFHFSLSKDSCPEEDRELNEMWMEIETIEENLIDTLVNNRAPDGTEEDVEIFYFDFVNETILDISRKNDNIWEKEAGHTDDYDNASSWAMPYGEGQDRNANQIDEDYLRAVNNLNKETANNLLIEDKRNNDDAMKLISEHRHTQLELFKYRMDEKKRLDEKLKEKLARGKQSSGVDSDSDREDVKAKYGQLMSNDTGDSENEPIELDAESSSDSYSESGTDSSSLQGQVEIEANSTLKMTLKEDVATNINRMSVHDFQNLMTLYREERNGLKQIKDGEKSKLDQSLWAKLAQRRKEVDQYVHGDDEEEDDSHATNTHVNTASSAVTSSSSAAVGTHVQMADAGTGMGGTLQLKDQSDSSTGTEAVGSETNVEKEIKKQDHEFINKVTKESKEMDKDAFHKLVRDHLTTTTKLREEKSKAAKLHAEKLKEKLRLKREKMQQRGQSSDSSSNSSSSSEDSDANSPARHGDGKDKDYQRRLEDNTDDVLAKLESGEAGVDSDKLAAILAQYHEDQEELLRQRQLRYEQMNHKLQEKLERRKRIQEQRKQEEEGQIEQNDNDFYFDLIRRRRDGDINDADIGRLMEEHLGKQEDEIRKQKHEERMRKREQRRRERAANSDMAQDLMEEEREQAKQRKQMRHQEKQKTDIKLQEKLRRKKQEKTYMDTPELPGPRVPPKESANVETKARHGNKPGNYENVDVK